MVWGPLGCLSFRLVVQFARHALHEQTSALRSRLSSHRAVGRTKAARLGAVRWPLLSLSPRCVAQHAIAGIAAGLLGGEGAEGIARDSLAAFLVGGFHAGPS